MGTTTAVFLGDRSLAVVAGRASGRGGVELTHAASAVLPEGFGSLDADAQAVAIGAALQTAGDGHRKCVLVVPRPLAILRTFTVPSGTTEELQNMIRFQLEKDLPLPLDQVRYAYTAGPEDGKVWVTAAAVPREALDKRLAALEKAGMHVTGAVVTSFGLIRLLPPGHSDGGSLLLSLADGVGEILVADSGRIQLSRNAPLRNPDAEGWAAEIDRALLSRPGAELKRVFVAGEGDIAEQVAAELKKRIPATEISALVPNGTVTRRHDVRISSECAATAGVVVGLLTPGPAMPDLLKAPVVRRTLKIKRSHKFLAAAGILFVVLIGASQIVLAGRRSDAEEMRQAIVDLKPKTDAVDRMRSDIRLLQQWQDRRFAWIDLFEQLQRRMPAGRVHLTSFSADESGGVRLSGRAKDNSAALEVANELQKMGAALAEVGSPQIRLNNTPGDFKHDFDIRVVLADLAPPKPALKSQVKK